MTILIILGIILYFAGAVVCICVKGDFAGLVGTILVTFGITIVFTLRDADSPSAIDVHRGKTTLEITSVDGVPTDSVVVFKKTNK